MQSIAADDHDRQRLLGLRADRGREGGRQQAQRGGERCHDDRSDAQLGAAHHRFAHRQAGRAHLIEIRDQQARRPAPRRRRPRRNPTAAEIENGVPVNQSARMPPIVAATTLAITRSASLIELNAV